MRNDIPSNSPTTLILEGNREKEVPTRFRCDRHRKRLTFEILFKCCCCPRQWLELQPEERPTIQEIYSGNLAKQLVKAQSQRSRQSRKIATAESQIE